MLLIILFAVAVAVAIVLVFGFLSFLFYANFNEVFNNPSEDTIANDEGWE